MAKRKLITEMTELENRRDEIIRKISQARTIAGLSARELSLMIGKNEAYISRMESKQPFEPSVSTLLEIIDACEMTETQFFYYDMNEYETDMKLIELLKGIKDKEVKQLFLDLLEKYNKNS